MVMYDTGCLLFKGHPAPQMCQRLLECLSTYFDVKFNCFITGDLNYPIINWNLLKSKVDGTLDELLNFTVTHGVSQLVQSATRADNLLDIVLTSEPLSICNVDVIQPLR
jgi:Endonuclease-reverse transcriptase